MGLRYDICGKQNDTSKLQHDISKLQHDTCKLQHGTCKLRHDNASYSISVSYSVVYASYSIISVTYSLIFWFRILFLTILSPYPICIQSITRQPPSKQLIALTWLCSQIIYSFRQITSLAIHIWHVTYELQKWHSADLKMVMTSCKNAFCSS